MSGWRLALAWPIGIVGAAAALLTVVAFFGRWWWGFDVVSSFRPQYLAVLAASGLALGAVASWPVGLALLLAAVPNLAVVVPLYLASGPAAAPDAPTLEIVSFNVQASNRQKAEIMAWVHEEDADLAFIIESSFEWEDAAERAGIPYTIAERVPIGRVFGLTLLVRDGVEVESRQLLVGDRGAVEVTTRLGDTPVSVLAIHPRSPVSKARADKRNQYLQLVTTWARDQEGPVVVIGDFNATPWSSSFRRLTAGARLRNSQVGYGLQPSFPSGWGPLMIPIDHALHSPELAIVDRRTGPALGSDHRPLIVSVAPTGGNPAPG